MSDTVGWRPIETAPRDGRHILLYERENDSVCEGRYVTDACRWFERNAHPTDAWDGEIYRPTHWMPLPSPPKESDD